MSLFKKEMLSLHLYNYMNFYTHYGFDHGTAEPMSKCNHWKTIFYY